MWIFFLLLSAILAAGASDAYAAEPALLSKTGETAPIPTTITAKKVTDRSSSGNALWISQYIATPGKGSDPLPLPQHCRHLSHRLVSLGMRPPLAVFTIYLISLGIGLGAVGLAHADLVHALLILVPALAVLVVVLILLFYERRTQPRREDA